MTDSTDRQWLVKLILYASEAEMFISPRVCVLKKQLKCPKLMFYEKWLHLTQNIQINEK